jgi:hypothetical protein
MNEASIHPKGAIEAPINPQESIINIGRTIDDAVKDLIQFSLLNDRTVLASLLEFRANIRKMVALCHDLQDYFENFVLVSPIEIPSERIATKLDNFSTALRVLMDQQSQLSLAVTKAVNLADDDQKKPSPLRALLTGLEFASSFMKFQLNVVAAIEALWYAIQSKDVKKVHTVLFQLSEEFNKVNALMEAEFTDLLTRVERLRDTMAGYERVKETADEEMLQQHKTSIHDLMRRMVDCVKRLVMKYSNFEEIQI